jgi:hypothetical protein
MDHKIIELFSSMPPKNCGVLDQSLPVPFFGKYRTAVAATISLNPSANEFESNKGDWLIGDKRRLSSLQSLNASSGQKLSMEMLQTAHNDCENYFSRGQAYWTWFRHLENLLKPFQFSYETGTLVHLDISPWATKPKWAELMSHQQQELITNGGAFLKWILRNFQIKYVFLNGRTSLDSFTSLMHCDKQTITESIEKKKTWRLVTSSLSLPNSRQIKLFGWNNYIQQSGVSTCLREFLKANSPYS